MMSLHIWLTQRGIQSAKSTYLGKTIAISQMQMLKGKKEILLKSKNEAITLDFSVLVESERNRDRQWRDKDKRARASLFPQLLIMTVST